MTAVASPPLVPLQVPWYGPEEERAAVEALRSGSGIGDGPIGQRVEREMACLFGARHVLLTTSATHALELAILALGLGPGDEVILPSFTFASCANAIALRGARPVFAEIRPDTLDLDPEDVRRRITPRTRAIMPMHYAGVACDMDPLLALAREHGLSVVEDAAQGVDARYKGRYLGTLGDIGCYSFHATKNLACGEGGAFLTNDDELAHRAEIIREKGTNRQAFLRGEVDKYTWVSVGSSYVLSDVLAAVLEAQLAKREAIRNRRRLLWETYAAELAPLAASGRVTLAVIPPECESNYHIFFLRTRTPEERGRLLRALRDQGIGATFHYVPLHSAPRARSSSGQPERLPLTELASCTLVRLPLYPALPIEECRRIARVVVSISSSSAA